MPKKNANRVLLVSHSAQLAGAERSALALVEVMLGHGVDVLVSVPHKGPLHKEFLDRGVRCFTMATPLWISRSANRLVLMFRLLHAIVATPWWVLLLLRVKPRLVITNSVVVPSPAFACFVTRTRHCWFVRESVLTNPTLNSILPRTMILTLVCRLSTHIFAVSRFVEGQLASVGAQAVTVVWPPVRAVRSRPAAPAGEDFVALFAGSFTADKGLVDALEAIRIARTMGSRVELVVAGSGGSLAIDSAAEELALERNIAGAVRFVGWQSDIGQVIPAASALLMPAHNEAFGRITVEAISAGMPVVAYNCGGSAEILQAGGGILVEPTPHALAEGLRALAHDNRLWTEKSKQALVESAIFTDIGRNTIEFVEVVRKCIGEGVSS